MGGVSPACQVSLRITQRLALVCAHDAKRGEGRRRKVDLRVRPVGYVDHGNPTVLQQGPKRVTGKAFVPCLDRVAKGQPVKIVRQKVQETRCVAGIKALCRKKLPVDRAKRRAKVLQARGEKPRDPVARPGKLANMVTYRGAFSAKTKSPGTSPRHLAKVAGVWVL